MVGCVEHGNETSNFINEVADSLLGVVFPKEGANTRPYCGFPSTNISVSYGDFLLLRLSTSMFQ
jgi:hypothetical protein